jgi:(p)ppGpp synthase/HD superfamily hydrolase
MDNENRELDSHDERHALLIAEAAHYLQFDKGRKPRIEHVTYVGNQFFDSTFRIVGYLHDVLEDSPLFSGSGIAKVFGREVADALDAITRRENERYFDYIDRCKRNRIARLVKKVDIEHNMDRTRWPEMPDSYYEREVKALKILTEANGSKS